MTETWLDGFAFGALLGGLTTSLFALWCFGSAWDKTMRLWNDHEDWLRRQVEKRLDEGDSNPGSAAENFR